MRKILLFSTLTFAALSVAAQQQPAQPSGKEKQAAPAGKSESNFERRIRTEGAAGGTAPVPEEQRKSVGAGAKPHTHFDPLDRGLQRRSDAEVIAPAK
jgi:hypothetical protein